MGFILGCDANSHHTIWRSTDTNERGELLLDYILGTNLSICNVGCKPNFLTRNRKEVLNNTIVSNFMSNRVKNWKAPKEHSFSDHRYLQFEFDIKSLKIQSIEIDGRPTGIHSEPF